MGGDPENSMADRKRATPMRWFYIDCTAAYVWSLESSLKIFLKQEVFKEFSLQKENFMI